MITTETKIEVQKKIVDDLKSEISDLDRKIRNLESDMSHSSTMKHIGLTQMTVSSIRPIGTYNFLSNSSKESMLRIEINSLKSKKSSLESSLRKEKELLKEYEEEYEYENRPKANIVVEGDKIYVEGDEKKTNLLSPLNNTIHLYNFDYKLIIDHPEVKKYLELKENLESLVKTLNLPKAEHSLLHQMECYKLNYYCDFDYMVIDDKVLVDKDFITPKISEQEYNIKDYKKLIQKYKKDYESFEPTFFGKLIKPIGEKQREKFKNVVLNAEKSYKNSIDDANRKIANFKAIKEELIDPATPAMKILNDLKYLMENSYAVRQYIHKSAEQEKNITNGTILKSQNIKNISYQLLRDIKYYLDKNKLRVSTEEILEAIFTNEQFSDLAREIHNAIGYTPKAKKVEKSEETKTDDLSKDEVGPSFE